MVSFFIIRIIIDESFFMSRKNMKSAKYIYALMRVQGFKDSSEKTA